MGPLAIIEGVKLVSKFVSPKKKKPDFKILLISFDPRDRQKEVEISAEHFNLYASKYAKEKSHVFFDKYANELHLHIHSYLKFEEILKEIIEDVEENA